MPAARGALAERVAGMVAGPSRERKARGRGGGDAQRSWSRGTCLYIARREAEAAAFL